MKSDTHVRCESWKDTSAERKLKLEEGGETAERMMGSHAGSVHSEGGCQRRKKKQRRTGGRKRGTDRRVEVRNKADTQAMQDAQTRDKTGNHLRNITPVRGHTKGNKKH